MKAFFLPLALVLISGAGAAFAKISIPAGTVLPVALHGSLSTTKSKVGQVVKARVMQDIPLGEGARFTRARTFEGKVIAVTAAANGSGASITFEFDSACYVEVAERLTTSLRALASRLEVNERTDSTVRGDRGSSSYVNNTRQVGAKSSIAEAGT